MDSIIQGIQIFEEFWGNSNPQEKIVFSMIAIMISILTLLGVASPYLLERMRQFIEDKRNEKKERIEEKHNMEIYEASCIQSFRERYSIQNFAEVNWDTHAREVQYVLSNYARNVLFFFDKYLNANGEESLEYMRKLRGGFFQLDFFYNANRNCLAEFKSAFDELKAKSSDWNLAVDNKNKRIEEEYSMGEFRKKLLELIQQLDDAAFQRPDIPSPIHNQSRSVCPTSKQPGNGMNNTE